MNRIAFIHRASIGVVLAAIAGIALTAGLPAARADQTTAAVQDERVPLAVVGEDTISIADLDSEINMLLAAGQSSGAAGLNALDPEAVLRRLVQNRLLEQEGYRSGAQDETMVRNQLHEFVRLRSVKALMDSVSASAAGTDDAALGLVPGMTTSMRRYSHILVAEESTAAALRESLSLGISFPDLARRHSSDNTAAKGGDLGWAAIGSYVPEFEAAAGPLADREIAGPFRSKFGWHLVTLTEARTDTLKMENMDQAMREGLEKRRRMAEVRRYIESLREKYHVTVDDSLLKRLDYGSDDAGVQKQLQTSEEVLAVVPTGALTVRGLTRNIRFQYFHGTAGRAESDAIRDRMFDEWITEVLLSYEAKQLGFDRRPDITGPAKREERRLLREEVLTGIVTFEFQPEESQIRSFYETHLADFTPAPLVKVRSASFAKQESAERFREQVQGGASFKWLAGRTPEVAEAEPPLPADWVSLKDIEFGGDPLAGPGNPPPAVGSLLGPKAKGSDWLVVEITAVQEVSPEPLEQCKDRITRVLRGQRTRQAIEDAVARLESATRIKILDSAREAVKKRIETWQAASTEGGRS